MIEKLGSSSGFTVTLDLRDLVRSRFKHPGSLRIRSWSSGSGSNLQKLSLGLECGENNDGLFLDFSTDDIRAVYEIFQRAVQNLGKGNRCLLITQIAKSQLGKGVKIVLTFKDL